MDEDMLECADHLIRALSYLDMDTTLRASMPVTWEHAARLLKSENQGNQLLGYSCLLTIIVTCPNAAQTLVERLRDHLARHTRGARWAT